MMKPSEFDRNTDRLAAVRIPYTRPCPEGLMAVRDFLFTEAEGGRCLLLRWVKEADFEVDSFTFELEQLDAAGGCLGVIAVTYQGMDIPPIAPGETFVPERGIAVHRSCTDIRVRLTELISGSYMYRVKGNRVEIDYRISEPWVYGMWDGREDGLSDTVSLRVVSGRRRRVRLLWPAAVLSVLLLILVILAPFIFHGEERSVHVAIAATAAPISVCDDV